MLTFFKIFHINQTDIFPCAFISRLQSTTIRNEGTKGSKKSPTGPTERTPKPEYLIALAIYLGVRWKGPIQFLMETKVYTPTNVAESYATETLHAIEEIHLRFINHVTTSLTFTTKSPTLRITGDPAKKRGLDVFFAGFWDLQTTSFEIP